MIEVYRKHIKAQEHHFRTDPAIQTERQRKAVEAWEAQEAERISRLPEIAAESEPILQNPLLRSRLKPIPKPISKQRVSRVAAMRAKQNQPQRTNDNE